MAYCWPPLLLLGSVPRPLQRQQGTACSIRSGPGQVAQPRPQQVDMRMLPTPLQSGQGGGVGSVMVTGGLYPTRTSPCWR